MTMTEQTDLRSFAPSVDGVFKFDPEGIDCADCGEGQECLWTDGEGGYVCENCKEW